MKSATVSKSEMVAILIKERMVLYDYRLEAEADFPEVLDGFGCLHHSFAAGIWCD
jgi:hypothetical protein